MKTKTILKLAAIAALALARPAFSQAPTEAQMLDVLKKADAPLKDKSDACKELAHLGTRNAVPVLAPLLADAQMSHMARYALEPIPDASVDAAFRDALGKAKGRQLAGILNSIGARRDEGAVAAVAGFLRDADAEVSFAAAATLGRIASKDAAAALEKAFAENPSALADGCLRCAQTMLDKGRASDAAALFEKVRAAKLADHLRLAATRGVICARGTDGIPFMVEQVRGGDPIGFIAALRAAQEGKGAKWSRALAGELANLPPQKQVPVLQTLGYRHDDEDAVVSAVLAVAKTGIADARVAAIQALTMIGEEDAVPGLVELAKASDESVAKAARSSLASFPAKETDDALAGLLKEKDTTTRLLAIDLLGQRRATGARTGIAKLVADPDEGIRMAAIEALGKLGGEKEVSVLLDCLLQAKSAKEAGAAESALTLLCTRQVAAGGAGAITKAFASAAGETKLALLRVLKSLGGGTALEAVRGSAQGGDPALKEAARRALCDWPTTDALSDLLKLAGEGEGNVKILALRGAIRLTVLQDLPAEKEAAQLGALLKQAERSDEKKQALAALGGTPALDALNFVTPCLATAELKEEASLAAVAIAEKIAEKNPAQVAEAMHQVLKETKANNTKKRADAVLAKLQK